MKIATKLTLTIFFMSFILIIVAGTSIFLITRSTLKTSVGENQLELASESMARIDRTLYERYLDIQDFANSVIIQNYILGNAPKEDVENRLASFFDTSGPWDTLKIVGADGTILFASDNNLVGNDIRKKKEANIAFQKSLKGEVFVSDIIISDDSGKPTILFSAPVKAIKSQGRFIVGVVIGQFTWSTIEDILISSRKNPSHMHLFSKDGMLIGSSNANQESAKNFEQFDVRSIVWGAKTSTIMKSRDGKQESLVSLSPQLGYLGYKGSNWNLGLETPVDAVFASVYKNAYTVVLVFTPIALLSAFILVYLIIKLFVDPVKYLVSVATAIQQGDLNKRVEITSNDEFGELGRAFNVMTDTLLKTQKGIEQKVKERTHDLEVLNREFVGRELQMIELKKTIKNLEDKVSDVKKSKTENI
jgi:methyl-accepting chemotaxis protein